MKAGVKSIVVLGIICLVSSALLGGVNYFTAPVIEKTTKERSEAACFEVMPSGQAFETVKEENAAVSSSVKEIYKEKNGAGYVIKVSTKGYDSGLVIMCGISTDGKVTGTKILSSNETPSIGGQLADSSFGARYSGKDAGSLQIETVTGATLTSKGYYNAVKTALETFAIIEGGTK